MSVASVWRRGLAVVAAAVLACGSVGSGAAAAQEPGTADGAVVTEAAAAPSPAVTAAPGADPLPQPDFSRAYRHVFLAFAFAWVLLLAYAVLLQRRLAEAEIEVERLG